MLKKITMVSGLFWNNESLTNDERINTMLKWINRWKGSLINLENDLILFLETKDETFEDIILSEKSNIKIVYLDIFKEYSELHNTIKDICDNDIENHIKENKGKKLHHRNIFIWWLKTHLVMRAYDMLEDKDTPIMWVDFGIMGETKNECLYYDNDRSDILSCTCSSGHLDRLKFMSFDDIIDDFYKRRQGICIMGGCFVSNYDGWKFFNKEISNVENELIERKDLVDDDVLYNMVYQRFPEKFTVLTLQTPKTGFTMMLEYIRKLEK